VAFERQLLLKDAMGWATESNSLGSSHSSSLGRMALRCAFIRHAPNAGLTRNHSAGGGSPTSQERVRLADMSMRVNGALTQRAYPLRNGVLMRFLSRKKQQ